MQHQRPIGGAGAIMAAGEDNGRDRPADCGDAARQCPSPAQDARRDSRSRTELRASPTVAAITGMAEVARCYSLSGEIDLLVEIEAADAAQLNATRDRIATIAGVEDTTTALILKRDKDR